MHSGRIYNMTLLVYSLVGYIIWHCLCISVVNRCSDKRCWPLCLLVPNDAVCVCPNGAIFINTTHCNNGKSQEWSSHVCFAYICTDNYCATNGGMFFVNLSTFCWCITKFLEYEQTHFFVKSSHVDSKYLFSIKTTLSCKMPRHAHLKFTHTYNIIFTICT